MSVHHSVDEMLERDEQEALERQAGGLGPVARIARKLSAKGRNLLGFILDMSYDSTTIVTCDNWKRKCGGVPKNSFVIIRLTPKIAALGTDEQPKPSLILARITEGVATPVSADVQQTIFEIHKILAVVDPYTDAELQWGALKATILGTYYDGSNGDIQFGADIDSYLSPHFYEVYVPAPVDLELLVNSFVNPESSVALGKLRYTETSTMPGQPPIAIKVAPRDFVANRTALFGKTRSGKSNTIKMIADMMLRSPENIGQVIFDLGAEYAYWNDQDKTSLYDMHRDNCVRYSMNPGNRVLDAGEQRPRPLKVNFLKQVQLGHSLIVSLWDTVHTTRPKYFLPLLGAWEPCDRTELDARFPGQEQKNEQVRYLRAESMYFAALKKAGFEIPDGLMVDLHLNRNVRRLLAQDGRLKTARREGDPELRNGASAASLFQFDPAFNVGDVLSGEAEGRLDEDAEESNRQVPLHDQQSVNAAVQIYQVLYELQSKTEHKALFEPSKSSGKPYFEEIHLTLLAIIGERNVSGTRYLIPFAPYHGIGGSQLTDDIVNFVNARKTVIIDLSNSDEQVAQHFSTLICTAIFKSQVQKFATRNFKGHSVLLYFEEAHNLFERDDANLRSIYNRLAKEGAKYQIGLVYGTQSMTTLSPDLLKNTENFFIAHLNDDREVRELTRH